MLEVTSKELDDLVKYKKSKGYIPLFKYDITKKKIKNRISVYFVKDYTSLIWLM